MSSGSVYILRYAVNGLVDEELAAVKGGGEAVIFGAGHTT